MIRISVGMTNLDVAGAKEVKVTGYDSDGTGSIQWWDGCEWRDFVFKPEPEHKGRRTDTVLIRVKS